MRKTIIGGILLAVATFFIQKTYFTDRPEVVYSLSNEIYTSLLESEDREIIQQLTIKNIGNQGVERIVVTINNHVDKYDLRKYSESDSVRVIATKTKFELIYPSLPPDGQIEILIKNVKKGLTKDLLTVKHNSGLGKEAFEKSSSYSLLTLLPFIFWVAITLASAFGLYKDSFHSDIKYDPVDKILKRPKPLFISSFKWNEFRKEAIGNYFNKDRAYSKLNDLICWQVLSDDKPNHLSADEWAKVLSDATSKFKELFTERIVTRSYLTLSDELFSIEKPKQIGLPDWKEIVNLINNYYVFYSLAKQKLTWNDEFTAELKREKLNLIESDVDKRYKAIVREIFFSKLVGKLIRMKRSDGFPQEDEILLLNDDQKKEISEITNGIVDLKRAMQYRKKLREVVNGELKNTDNDLVIKEDWDSLTELNQKISKILKDKAQAEEDSVKFRSLRKRVERQLEIIDRIVSNPDYVEKIEDYNDAFNTGNLGNLLKISTALKVQNRGRL
jgi:hypothetical protein